MNTVPRIDLEGPLPLESTNDTKRAAVFVRLGLPLKHVSIVYDAEHPKETTGGQAHLVFVTDLEGLAKLHQVYDADDANVRLDEMPDQAKNDPALRAFVTELEKHMANALIVYGRRYLENHQRLIEFLRDQAPEFVVIGGEPVVNAQGRQVGLQGFNIKYVKRGGKK